MLHNDGSAAADSYKIFEITPSGNFLWLSTDGGLFQFEKPTEVMTQYVDVFIDEEPDSYNNNFIRSTAVAPDGRLYIAKSPHALFVFDGNKLVQVTEVDVPNIRNVKFDLSNRLWVLCFNLYCFDNGIWQLYEGIFPGCSSTIDELVFQSDGTPWVGGGCGLGKLADDKLIPISQEFWSIHALAVGPDDWVWCGRDGELVRTNGTEWITYSEENTNYPSGTTYTLHFDSTGTLWAGGYQWAGTFDGVTWAVYDSTDCEYLDDTAVYDLLIEDDGTLWLGTSKNGLIKFDGSTWTQYDVTPEATGFLEVKPGEIELWPAYPNPFNPPTTISYTLPEPSPVTLIVYSITGQKVATLVDETMDSGTHRVVFNGTGLASGVYFYRLESPGFSKTGKMLLMK